MGADLGGFAKFLLEIHFNLLGIDINIGDVVGSMEKLIRYTGISEIGISNTSIGALMSNLTAVCTTVGLTLLGAFTMMNLIRLAMDPERISWEKVMMVIVRFLIFKMFIDNATRFFRMVFSIADKLITDLMGSFAMNPNAAGTMAEQISEGINNAKLFSFLGLELGPIFAFTLFCLFYLTLVGTVVGIIGQVLYRVLKIVVYQSISPVFISIGSFEDGAGTGKRYLMTAVAIALEGVIMMIMLKMYSLLMATVSVAGDNPYGLILATLILNSMLTLGISQAGTMAERWTGA
ncbi:hypothetical protein [Faecalibaculum rodentium]|jgi:hypothetical protein|uniref:hypothetical protein n=1 Tax=Faecalibaculum rodentium TaxID=1702221 RepID=UPI0024924BD4|nr:hypothetical protein [Faecalibaculum rodentium]